MIDPNAPAYPHPEYVIEEHDKARVYVPQPGMTIRATMAMHLHAAYVETGAGLYATPQERARYALAEADALIAELNKEKP